MNRIIALCLATFLALAFLGEILPASAQTADGLEPNQVASSTSDTSSTEAAANGIPDQSAPQEEPFEAKILKVLDQRYSTDTDSGNAIQQNLELQGLSGDWKGKTFEYIGISDVTVFGSIAYKAGDHVLVQHSVDGDGKDVFYVMDFIRRPYIYGLAILFCLAIIFTAKQKGFRSLLGLIFSFVVIMGAIIPLILSGWSPLPVGIIGSILIYIFMVSTREGLNKKSFISILTMAISLTLVGIMSVLFTWATRLTGTAQEETMFLVGVAKQAINFKGLLLTGILVGTLGVLDDMIIGQIEAVVQIKTANPYLDRKKVFSMAHQVGNSHMGSMVNTLFLAYAGASLPLLLLFSVKQSGSMSFSQAINSEMITTEIMRTLIGGIGIALSVPIATYLASKYYDVPKPEKRSRPTATEGMASEQAAS